MSNILEQGIIKSGLLNLGNTGLTTPVDDMATFLEKELDDMTADLDLPFGSSDLMSSEFFDSVLSMERENGLDSVLNGYAYDLNFSDGGTISNNDSHSALSPSTTSSDSDDRFNVIQDVAENKSITLFSNEVSAEIMHAPVEETDLSAYCNEKETSLISNYTSPSTLKNKVIMRRHNRINNNYNNNNKKIIVSNPVSNNKSVMKNNQVIRVQSISGNGRSLLLPVNVKKIKIVNANNLKMENIKVIQNSTQQSSTMRKVHIDKYASSSGESVDDDMELDDSCSTFKLSIPASKNDRSYPPLELTTEERRLLYKEGIQLPTHYPLTKNEEKELKRIRRKIRNKISAQDSRKRKKEYVDKLEEQAKRTCEENEFLKKRIKLLRKQNTKLMDQMRRLQEVLFRSSGTKATPTTCLMIVLFSTLLVCLPNMQRSTIDQQQQQQQSSLEAAAKQQNIRLDSSVSAQSSTPRRALLFNQKGDANEDIVSSIQDLLVFKKTYSHTPTIPSENDKQYQSHAHRKHKYIMPDDGEVDTDATSEEFLAKCFDRDGNIRQNISGILGEFCKRYEGDILVLLKNMLQSQQVDTEFLFADEECEDDCDGDSGYGVLDRNLESFIEPDISDDDGDGLLGKQRLDNIEQLVELGSQPAKRRRTATLDSGVNIHAK